LPKEQSKLMANISGLYINEGDPQKAIEWCEKALALNPKNHGAHVNLGMAHLELGHWKQGWEGWAHSFPSGDRHQRNYEGVPVWDGTPGQTVIVWGDQGVGDEIFYACCLADMGRVCKKVIFDCHPRLELLFRRSFPQFDVYGTRKDLSPLEWVDDCGADAAVCIADLPQYFRQTDASWGDGAAYLKAAPAIKSGSGLRVGLSWTGGTKRTRIDLRSLPLQDLGQILDVMPDAQWFSLQYTPDAARQVCELEEETGIRISHFPGWVEHFDYDRTASFVASLDLVITVCTTVHHLAGALGVPVWTLTPSRPSWRYQLKGNTLPWYKSARMFRQTRDGSWAEPVQRVADELADFGRVPEAERRVA
jgi:tetratricopeptide repeat protein